MTLYNKLFSAEIETVVVPKEFGVDEMLAVGLIMVVQPEIQIEFRTKDTISDIKDDPKFILVNIGAGEFDSHQAFFDIDENGNKLTAFSKLWKELGEDIMGYKGLSDVFNAMIVEDIDHILMVRYKAEVSFNIIDILSYYLPEWNEKFETENEARIIFRQAAKFANESLVRLVNHYIQLDKALDIIYDKIEENNTGILVFDQFLPMFNSIDQINLEEGKKPVYFVVYPDKKDNTKYTFQSQLVNGVKKVIDKKKAPTEKDALVEYLKQFI